jgi:hypothetical protein
MLIRAKETGCECVDFTEQRMKSQNALHYEVYKNRPIVLGRHINRVFFYYLLFDRGR